MRRLAAGAALLLLAAGCGGAAQTAKPPRLPRPLARSWAQQARQVDEQLRAGDDCAARTTAAALRQHVVAAVKAHRVPQPFLESLTGAVNDLAERIVCTPAPPPPPATVSTPTSSPPPGHGHGHGRGEGRGHGRGHGKGHGKDDG